MTKIFLVFLTLAASTSQANTDWFEKGNGGTVMVCRGQLPKTLDLFEAERVYNLQIDQSHVTTVEERINYIFDNLKKLNPYRTSQYRYWFSTFYKETEFIDGESLGPVFDVGPVRVPDGCEIKQVVFQRQPTEMNKFRYRISLKWWNQLSVTDQAAMILHELIYREMALPPNLHTTSEFSRHLNAWLNSTASQNAKIETYLSLLQNLPVVNAEFGKYQILLNTKDTSSGYWLRLPLNFQADGAVTITLNGNQGLDFQNHFMNTQCDKTGNELTTGGVLKLSSIQLPVKLTPLKKIPAIVNCKHILFSKNISEFRVEGDIWNFEPNGEVFSAFGIYQPQSTSYAPVRSKGHAVNIGTAGSPVELTTYFDKSGDLRMVDFNSKICRQNATDVVLFEAPPEHPPRTSLSFDPADNELEKVPLCN